MYIPRHYAAPSPQAALDLLRTHPLATLVWVDANGDLQATPLPLLLRGETELAAHLPRANPLVAHLQAVGEAPLLAVFRGPDGYVSPSWRPSKALTHREVPTWNYATAQVHGRARLHDDAQWVRAQMHELTTRLEARQPQPWAVADTQPEHLAAMLRVLVGLSLRIERIEAKFKLDQAKSAADREGVAAQLAEHADTSALADLMRRH